MSKVIKDLRETNVVYATSKHQYYAAGTEIKAAPAVCELMIEKGWATKEPQKVKETSK